MVVELIRFTTGGVISLFNSSGQLDLSCIAAGQPNLKITATSDTPSTTFSTLTGFNQLPDGYMEMIKNGSAVYVPFFR